MDSEVRVKLAKDWEQQRKRVKWLSTSFGLGRMLAEFETHDGKKHSLYAATSLELLGKVRAAIDEQEEDPVAKELEKIVNEPQDHLVDLNKRTDIGLPAGFKELGLIGLRVWRGGFEPGSEFNDWYYADFEGPNGGYRMLGGKTLYELMEQCQLYAVRQPPKPRPQKNEPSKPKPADNPYRRKFG